MGYLSRTRVRFLFASFIATSLLLAAFPQIDLAVSRLFYAGHFPFDGTGLQKLIRNATTAFLSLSLLGVTAVYLLNRVLRRNLANVDGKRVCYVVIVLALGAGLIVNTTLKDNFGRARPLQVAEFGGTKTFTPAFAMANECRKNCSFSSGEAAAGFFSIVLVYAFARRRRAAWVAAITFGWVVSVARIAAGAHFLSDVVVSFFIMLILADVLHYSMRLDPSEEGPELVPDGVLARATVADVASRSSHR